MSRIAELFAKLFGKKQESEAPGWDAIDAALAPIYGKQEPRHMGVVVPYALGGPDPLQGISAYLAAGPPRHWHYVTYGFTDLFVKESQDPGVSGWGFELTFRLESDAEEPPMEPFVFLQSLARYVFKTGRVYGVGDHVDIGEQPAELATRIRALVIAEDPQLRPTRSKLGGFDFRQVVGLTQDEYELVQTWNSTSFLELVRPRNPLLVTDLKRASWLEDPAIRQTAETAREREGSATWATFVRHLEIRPGADRVEIEIDPDVAAKLRLLLTSRSAAGRFHLVRGERGVHFHFGEPAGWREEDGVLVVTLGRQEAESLAAAIAPLPGNYASDDVPFLQIAVADGGEKSGGAPVAD